MNAPQPQRAGRFRQDYRAALPAGYDGWRQQRRVTLAVVGTALLLLLGVQGWTWILLGVALAVWSVCCLVEYLAHRFPMHRPLPGLTFMFRQHVRVHHRYFTDREMAGGDGKDVHATVLAPVQLLALVLLGALPLSLGVALLLGGDAARICGATVLVYLSVFEWVHLACHLPADHPALRIPGLARVRAHHRRHHAPKNMTAHNFLISNPWMEWPLGSRLGPAEPEA